MYIGTYKQSSRLKTYIFSLMLLLCLLFSSISVNAETNDNTAEGAYKTLTSTVGSAISGNHYESEGGGYLMGSQLLISGDGGIYELNEGNFAKLTSKAQSELVSDIASESNKAVGTNNITEETVQNWWKDLQSKDGVGSKFLSTILENTKPDFVAANAIWKPFAGPVGILLGLIAVMMMSFLGVVMVADLAYIGIPPVRLFVSDDENGDKIAKSKIFSHDALYAVQKAETESDGGSPKQALGIYLKRRIGMLILLGICLLYLVQGQIYTLVGYILDLLSGFLGF